MLINDATILSGFTALLGAVVALWRYQVASNKRCEEDRAVLVKAMLDLTSSVLSIQKTGRKCAGDCALKLCPVSEALESDHNLMANKLAEIINRNKMPLPGRLPE